MAEPRSESGLIRKLGGPLSAAGPTGRVPFGDDAAPLAGDLLWTVDMLMDGVDFDSLRHDWRSIGRKAMAVNLSDCAAMAVEPVGALCAVALNDGLSMSDAESLMLGAHEFGVQFGCPLRGGDTNSWSQPTVISVTVAARCPAGRAPILRSGAHSGETIYLTGPVGGSILGRHMTFEPRVALALRLAASTEVHAMIDISDGFSLDLARICDASGCGARIEAIRLDALIHADARRLAAQTGRSARDHALSDGEDFELIVVTPALSAGRSAELGLHPVGQIVPQPGLWLAEDGRETPLEPAGWEHFR